MSHDWLNHKGVGKEMSHLPPGHHALLCHKINRQTGRDVGVVVARSGTPQAHHRRLNEGETERIPDTGHGSTVFLLVVFTYQGCKGALVESFSCNAHASRSREHQGCERAMLNFTYSLFIRSPLFQACGRVTGFCCCQLRALTNEMLCFDNVTQQTNEFH